MFSSDRYALSVSVEGLRFVTAPRPDSTMGGKLYFSLTSAWPPLSVRLISSHGHRHNSDIKGQGFLPIFLLGFSLSLCGHRIWTFRCVDTKYKHLAEWTKKKKKKFAVWNYNINLWLSGRKKYEPFAVLTQNMNLLLCGHKIWTCGCVITKYEPLAV